MKVRRALIVILLAWATEGFAVTGATGRALPQADQTPQPPRADEPTRPPDNARFGDPTDTARNLQNYVYGVVSKVETADLICDKTEFGDAQAFKLTKKTRVIRDGKRAEPDDLKAGDKVWIKIKTDKKTGDITALRVVAGVLSINMK